MPRNFGAPKPRNLGKSLWSRGFSQVSVNEKSLWAKFPEKLGNGSSPWYEVPGNLFLYCWRLKKKGLQKNKIKVLTSMKSASSTSFSVTSESIATTNSSPPLHTTKTHPEKTHLNLREGIHPQKFYRKTKTQVCIDLQFDGRWYW